MVSWIIKGEYEKEPYSLIPRGAYSVTYGTVGRNDTIIRASTINDYN
ncbi:MAG: hypothetical protein Q4B28_02520 [bacterium]|nr:hypothetical protein [bacterium]